MQGMLRLMPAAMLRLFQPTLDNIKNAISQVLASPDVTGLPLLTQSLSLLYLPVAQNYYYYYNRFTTLCPGLPR